MKLYKNDCLAHRGTRWGPLAGIIFIILICTSCGKKGPLYLPDEAHAPKQTAEPAAPPASPLPQK